MNYVDQEIVVQGAEDESPGVGIAFGGKLFRQIERTVQPCVRMALTGRSAQVGQPPKWLQAAWDVRATGFSRRGSDMVIHLSVPKLGDAAPKVFEQQRLWDEAVKPDETALELMGKLVQDVREQVINSDAYDAPMLSRLTGWNGLLESKIRTVVLPTNGMNSPNSILDGFVIAGAKALSNRIPAERQVRVVGKIDMVRYSTWSMGLRLDDGSEVRCAVVNEEISELGEFLNKEVTVLGKAIYRPSGSVLRLDVEQILETTSGRGQFSQVPLSMEIKPKLERRVQTARTGVAAMFGTWPGDETDEELLAALTELRR
jgi:hypothetical protein